MTDGRLLFPPHPPAPSPTLCGGKGRKASFPPGGGRIEDGEQKRHQSKPHHCQFCSSVMSEAANWPHPLGPPSNWCTDWGDRGLFRSARRYPNKWSKYIRRETDEIYPFRITAGCASGKSCASNAWLRRMFSISGTLGKSVRPLKCGTWYRYWS